MNDKKYIVTGFRASVEKDPQTVGIINKRTVEYPIFRRVDLDEYAELLEETYNKYDAEGYDVVNVVPITMGETEQNNNQVTASFGITRGAIVVGKRRD